MGSLGDFFPSDMKEDFVHRNLVVKSVVKAHVSDTTPPKEKRFLVIGISESTNQVAAVYFNTNKPKNIYIKNLQYFFNNTGRSYLSNNCYLDCSQVHQLYINYLQDHLKNNPEFYLGKMDKSDFNKVIKLIVNSRTISPKIIKIFGLEKFKQSPQIPKS